jgi:DNA-binding LacI/PurR family transcriptional regulator
VGTETRRTVQEIVDKVAYRPNRAARSLRTSKGYEIALVLGSLDELHMTKVAGFVDALKGTDYSWQSTSWGSNRSCPRTAS